MSAIVRVNAPAEGCKATKEELLGKKKNPLDVDDDCPICRDTFNVLCQVGCHPTVQQGIAPLLHLFFSIAWLLTFAVCLCSMKQFQ